jgi:hypothetical protein
MCAMILDLNWSAVTEHPALLGFLVITGLLLGLLALDYSKNAKTIAREKSPKQLFLARYRDADGMPVYYDLDTYSPDSPAYSTRQIRPQTRRVAP